MDLGGKRGLPREAETVSTAGKAADTYNRKALQTEAEVARLHEELRAAQARLSDLRKSISASWKAALV
jgi:uncharacterized coiled-coil DUF342 family protein